MRSIFNLRFLLVVILALLSVSNLVYADDAESSESAEAVVDATGDVQVEEPESVEPPSDTDDNSAAEAEAEAAARQAEVEAAAAKAAAEAAAVVEEVEETKEKGTAFVSDVAASAKSKATALVDKAKEVTPEQMKKVAAGAIGYVHHSFL
jgi:flagellar biosynthesis/type III secretory pathway protein FliH